MFVSKFQWQSADGKVTPIPELATSHIVNIVNYQRRRARHEAEQLRHDVPTFWEADQMAMEERPAYKNVLREAVRRGIDTYRDPVTMPTDMPGYEATAYLTGRNIKIKIPHQMPTGWHNVRVHNVLYNQSTKQMTLELEPMGTVMGEAVAGGFTSRATMGEKGYSSGRNEAEAPNHGPTNPIAYDEASDVPSDLYRRIGKNALHSSLYGMGAQKMADNIIADFMSRRVDAVQALATKAFDRTTELGKSLGEKHHRIDELHRRVILDRQDWEGDSRVTRTQLENLRTQVNALVDVVSTHEQKMTSRVRAGKARKGRR
jgi:hypothetical protein